VFAGPRRLGGGRGARTGGGAGIQVPKIDKK